MRDPDNNLRGNSQINIEMHRMGMHDYSHAKGFSGRDYNSLLFGELLFATFMSGGYHPVFVEKWHDANAATDVVWVNQTWWLETELQAHRDIWTQKGGPEPPTTAAISPDPKELHRAHAAGEDPFAAPGSAVTNREKGKQGKGKKKNKKVKAKKTTAAAKKVKPVKPVKAVKSAKSAKSAKAAKGKSAKSAKSSKSTQKSLKDSLKGARQKTKKIHRP